MIVYKFLSSWHIILIFRELFWRPAENIFNSVCEKIQRSNFWGGKAQYPGSLDYIFILFHYPLIFRFNAISEIKTNSSHFPLLSPLLPSSPSPLQTLSFSWHQLQDWYIQTEMNRVVSIFSFSKFINHLTTVHRKRQGRWCRSREVKFIPPNCPTKQWPRLYWSNIFFFVAKGEPKVYQLTN